jgi:hypothetical protein
VAKSIIKHVRALVARGDSGADYHDKQGYHWIDDHIANIARAAVPSASTCSAR